MAQDKHSITLPWKGKRGALIIAAAKGRRFWFFLCCAATLGTVGFSFLTPQIIRITIDSFLGNMALNVPVFVLNLIERLGGLHVIRKHIYIPALFVVAAALCSALCNMLRRTTIMDIGETVAWRLRNTLYAHIQKLPYDWHVSCQTGDIIQRCTSDVDTIRTFIQTQLSELMRTICVFTIALLMMLSMDVFMSLVSLMLIPVIVVFSLFFFRRASREFAKAETAEGVMQAVAQENYTGVRVVRAFGRESYEMEKFTGKTLILQNIWISLGKMLGFFWGAGDFFGGLQLVVIVGVGIWRSTLGLLSPGTFLAFYAYCNMMIWPVRHLGRILSDLSKTLVACDRLRDILSAEGETEPSDALRLELKGELCFENVSFSYGNGAPVLQNISFTLKPGQSLAILGATGSGKSTMVHLLSRLYDVKEGDGRITIDGIDIRRISRPHLRRHIGLCLQEPFLFSKTIRENISSMKQEAKLKELQSAAAVAMLDESIENFAEGYDTVIGERGVTLSGGQKQRLAIARMLAANPPVMIFDDSFSAVDTETDAKIRANLRQRISNAAVIIISHRISSLMQADRILVLKNGTVEDIGSHEELLERGGTYSRIFALQHDEEADNG